jgi:hypothetical protein
MASDDRDWLIGDRPLVIVGMHRSGTSLAASLAAAAGIDLGPRLLGPGTGNLRGHFEDLEFLDLHQRILRANGADEDGFACGAGLTVPPALAREAAALVAARRSRGLVWGWKEPRTTLLVDFYESLLPQARYLCIFRRPWEVVDSLLRRGHSGDLQFADRPVLAARLWHDYNCRLIELLDRCPERSLVVESTQVAEDPQRLVQALERLLGVELSRPGPVFDPQLMRHDVAVARAQLVDAVCPEATRVYLELRRRAGADGPLPTGLGGGLDAPGLAAAGLAEWAAHERQRREAAATGAHVQELTAALDESHAACVRAHAALAAATADRQALAEHVTGLAEHSRRLTEDNAALVEHARKLQEHLESLQAHVATQQQSLERREGRIR